LQMQTRFFNFLGLALVSSAVVVATLDLLLFGLVLATTGSPEAFVGDDMMLLLETKDHVHPTPPAPRALVLQTDDRELPKVLPSF